MDTWMIILRIVHIFAGIFWVGAGFFVLLVVVPAQRKLQGGPNLMGLIGGNSGFNALMPLSALLTTVAGLVLYYEVSNGFNADWMESDGGIVLSIGSLAGLLAFGHGGAVIGPTSSKLGKLGEEISKQGTPPTPEQIAELNALQAKSVLHVRISVILMIVAVLGMSAARYM